MIGSIGDLVYLFPSLEVLRRRHVIDMGTGGYPYLAVVGNNPHLAQVYAPFIYPPETCAALGDRVTVVRQRRPFDDPAATSPEEVLASVERVLGGGR